MDDSLKALIDFGEVQVKPVGGGTDVSNSSSYKKLELSPEQKIQISGLTSQLSGLAVAGSLSEAYTLTFPEGVSGSLMKLRRGGYSTVLQDEHGHITGAAALEPMAKQAAFVGTLSVMAAVSGQYFLSEINSGIKSIDQKLDQVLNFLYDDKLAELSAEVNFVKYAYQNYSSILNHEEQRLATLISLQNSRKIALKDIDFYLGDLKKELDGKDVPEIIDGTLQCQKSLELAMQLYITSTILESYYSKNQDKNYLDNIEKDLVAYTDRWSHQLASTFSELVMRVNDKKKDGFIGNLKNSQKNNELKEKINEVHRLHEHYKDPTEFSDLRQNLTAALHAPLESRTYCVNQDGDVYLKVE